jgi:Uma2 family endonuclease
MQLQEKKQHYTFTEYETLEQETGERFLYYHGEVFAMAGTTLRHNKIVRNLWSYLQEILAEQKCEVFSENVKLELAPNAYYVYPDILLTCHSEDISDDEQTFIKYPSLIAEVLSESTQSYDMQDKKAWYFKIPALQYYLLIFSKKTRVELFERNGDFWIFRFFENLNESIRLEKLGVELPLNTIYKGISFQDK